MENQHESQCPQIQQEGEELVDRISSLPDHILGKILDEIPLEQAVKTSILSSRWRYLWTFTQGLVLHRGAEEVLEKFVAKVEHVLRHCRSMHLDAILLKFPEMEDFSRIEEWVSSALSCYPKFLSLVMEGASIELAMCYIPPHPRCVLSYNMMEDLYLGSYFEVEIPDTVASFPRLKRLKFTGWYPYHTSVLERLISYCPVLQVLRLSGYFDPYVQLKLDISTPTLLTLYLDLNYLYIYDDEEEDIKHTIIINTPNLKHLSVTDPTLTVYLVRNLESIATARVDYRRPWEGATEYVISSLLVLLKGVAKAKHLSLAPESVIILEATPRVNWPMFTNLTTLKLGIHDSIGWKLLRYCLETSPNLKCLMLYKSSYHEEEEDDREDLLVWNDPLEEVPQCLKRKLRLVQFESFKGYKIEIELVKYLLNNAKKLEVMLILHPDPLDGEMAERINMLPRASRTCQVNVYQGTALTRFGDVFKLFSKFPHARRLVYPMH